MHLSTSNSGVRVVFFSILLVLLSVNGYCQYKAVCFYVVGDQDQWQLFMGINAYNDLTSKTQNLNDKKVVFIYTGSGDKSCNGAPLNYEYYILKQYAANHSMEFAVDNLGKSYLTSTIRDTLTGHQVLRYQYNNVVSYSLRLPGGCDGGGFMGQSLQYFHDKVISSLNTIDTISAYTNWQDLVNTVSQIYTIESAGISTISINTADTDITINLGDHPDNLYTGKLCMDALVSVPHAVINLFQEYNTANLPVNLNNDEIATESALFSLFDFALTDRGFPTEFTPQNVSFTSRNYFRTITK